MKDYAQYKSTFVKPKQSKAIANAIEEIEKYCKGMILLHTIIHIAKDHGSELSNISKSRLKSSEAGHHHLLVLQRCVFQVGARVQHL